MALTKVENVVVDEWALTANTAVREGAEIDVANAYEATLNIKAGRKARCTRTSSSSTGICILL